MTLPAPPIQKLKVHNKEVRIVRDGLTSTFPGPNNSKIRGIHQKLRDLREQGVKTVASLDTRISRCGWAVSYVSKQLGMDYYDFYPRQGKDKPLPFYQKMCKFHGANLVPLRGNHQPVMRYHAERYLEKNDIDATLLPIGLSLNESVIANAGVVGLLPDDIFTGSLVACVSSGTTLAGVLHGLCRNEQNTEVYGVLTSGFKSRGKDIMTKIKRVTGRRAPIVIRPHKSLRSSGVVGLNMVKTGYEYQDIEPLSPPFPCDRYLDRKAWKFLVDNIDELEEPVTFWNVGGEWDPEKGLIGDLRGDGVVTQKEINEVMKNEDL